MQSWVAARLKTAASGLARSPKNISNGLPRALPVWAPHYTVHKTLLGLYDMAALAGSQQALEIISRWARWFYRWSGRFSRDGMDEILDVETGGMLELWADLYALNRRIDLS